MNGSQVKARSPPPISTAMATGSNIHISQLLSQVLDHLNFLVLTSHKQRSVVLLEMVMVVMIAISLYLAILPEIFRWCYHRCLILGWFPVSTGTSPRSHCSILDGGGSTPSAITSKSQYPSLPPPSPTYPILGKEWLLPCLGVQEFQTL